MPSRRTLAWVVFAASLVALFSYYAPANDHYDRLTRARQIAAYGDVPFRDFFDPGYFLALYSSVLMQRLFGDNLLGEAVLNCGFMAIGAVATFLLASRASGSRIWGLVAAGMVVVSQPRTYDYDKVMFFPLGLLACWHYIDHPRPRALWIVAAVGVIGGLFRYDTGIYLGSGAVMAVIARQWGTWRTMLVHLAWLAVAAAVVIAPALIYVQSTAGLWEAFDQIWRYAVTEGARTGLMRPPSFLFESGPLFRWLPHDEAVGHLFDILVLPGIVREENAAVWLYWVAVLTPLFAALWLTTRPAHRNRSDIARLLSFAVVAEMSARFILRDPLTARLGGVMALSGVGVALVAAEVARVSGLLREPRAAASGTAVRLTGALAFVLTVTSLWVLVWFPPRVLLQYGRRIAELSKVPVHTDLLPKGQLEPLVDYLKTCTRPTDRVLTTWFVPELNFFARRPFGGGLAVMLDNHWNQPRDQARAIAILESRATPVMLATRDLEIKDSHRELWAYIDSHYEEAKVVELWGGDLVRVWVRRGWPVTGEYAKLGLPCFVS